jgi:hypothetical protein
MNRSAVGSRALRPFFEVHPAFGRPRREFAPRSIIKALPACGAILALLVFAAAHAVAQTNGVWSSTAASGLWSSPTNWQSGNIADGTGATADFSQLTMTNDVTVSLDSSRTIGNLLFGDQGDTYNWTLDNNATPANVLNLGVSTGMPSITVNNGTPCWRALRDFPSPAPARWR